MAIGDRQRFITKILEKSLNQKAETDVRFDWFINKHNELNFGKYFNDISNIFIGLNGDLSANQNKRNTLLRYDAYFGGKYNLIFEFDEYQHFSYARFIALNNYPKQIKLNYSLSEWKNYCRENKHRADKYRFSKTTIDFNFKGGRTAQRAYLDCFRDFLPSQNGLNPTLRIAEFEVSGIIYDDIASQKKLRQLVENNFKLNIID